MTPTVSFEVASGLRSHLMHTAMRNMAVCSDMLCHDAPELGMTGRWVCITCLHATLHVIALSFE